MIGFLSGNAQKLSDGLLIHTNGVGYRVEVGESVLKNLTSDSQISLYIYTHVKEDALKLFGFVSEQDLSLFELVLGVSGVGPKIALALVDVGADRLVRAVQNAQVSFFSSVPRVGKKLAQKIIIELKSKLGGVKELELGPLSDKEQDVFEGLKSLGFDENSIQTVLREIDQAQTVEIMLKQAVKSLAKL
ncbi:MAG TPA: Holliday junction branch migration protein RuvA [Patescibacteria group bacterium]|jgi:Holliday junction DNA helicase RuvA